jgi:hypothetical protein
VNITYLANPVLTAVSPPSTVNTAPVMNEASSEERKRKALATSSEVPSLRDLALQTFGFAADRATAYS